MIRKMEREERRDLEAVWLELTWLKRDADLLRAALADAALDAEALTASVLVNALAARLAEVSEQLRGPGADQPQA